MASRQLPVADGVIASGDRPSDGAPGQGHSGTGARDVVSKSGARTVVAPEAGTVVDVYSSANPERADNTSMRGIKSTLTQGFADPWQGYGPGGIVLAGDSGAFHVLAHLASQDVAVGERVDVGERVGAVPSHVGASGAHVHWEVRKRPITTAGADRVDGALSAETWLAGASSSPAPSAASEKSSRIPGWAWLLGLLWLARRRR